MMMLLIGFVVVVGVVLGAVGVFLDRRRASAVEPVEEPQPADLVRALGQASRPAPLAGSSLRGDDVDPARRDAQLATAMAELVRVSTGEVPVTGDGRATGPTGGSAAASDRSFWAAGPGTGRVATGGIAVGGIVTGNIPTATSTAGGSATGTAAGGSATGTAAGGSATGGTAGIAVGGIVSGDLAEASAPLAAPWTAFGRQRTEWEIALGALPSTPAEGTTGVAAGEHVTGDAAPAGDKAADAAPAEHTGNADVAVASTGGTGSIMDTAELPAIVAATVPATLSTADRELLAGLREATGEVVLSARVRHGDLVVGIEADPLEVVRSRCQIEPPAGLARARRRWAATDRDPLPAATTGEWSADQVAS